MSDEGPQERFWREFEQSGEDTVRTNLALGRYDSKRARYATAWLEDKAHSRRLVLEASKEVSSAEQLSIARSAKDAAWAAAEAARDAARNAKRANIIATMALVIAAVGAAFTAYPIIRPLFGSP